MMSLLRIMYAPLDYVHSQRFLKPTEVLSPSLQQVVNHSLIKRYKLITELGFTVNSNDISHRVITCWNLLPKVAWLLGCKLARGSLAVGGQLATLPEVARRFVSLPLPCPAYPANTSFSPDDIELLGARYLYQLKPDLPEALAQRLPLSFAPESEVIDNANEAQPAIFLNRSLITFAFDYAQNPSN